MIGTLDLETLSDGIEVIPEDAAGFYRQNCITGFHLNQHESGVILKVDYDGQEHEFEVIWSEEVTITLIRAYAAHELRVAEFGACAIALLLIREITPFITVEISAIGTGIDYYLADKDSKDDLIFNHTAKLEVSGIITQNPNNTVERRIKAKINRLNPGHNLQTLICVVEFGIPCSKMVTV